MLFLLSIYPPCNCYTHPQWCSLMGNSIQFIITYKWVQNIEHGTGHLVHDGSCQATYIDTRHYNAPCKDMLPLSWLIMPYYFRSKMQFDLTNHKQLKWLVLDTLLSEHLLPRIIWLRKKYQVRTYSTPIILPNPNNSGYQASTIFFIIVTLKLFSICYYDSTQLRHLAN